MGKPMTSTVLWMRGHPLGPSSVRDGGCSWSGAEIRQLF